MTEYVKDLLTSPKYKNFRDHVNNLTTIPVEVYDDIHKKSIQSLNTSIDLDMFENEVNQIKSSFDKWGINPHKTNRYGLSLTDPIKEYNVSPHPACWPMDVWSWNHPHDPLTDVDFVVPNKYFYHFKSLQPLYNTFGKHICRLNVVWWDKGGEFTTHKDVLHDNALCFRTWIANKTDSDHDMYFGARENPNNLELVSNKLTAGNLYLLDTSCYHRGEANADNSYTVLMSLLPSAEEIIRTLINGH